MIGELKAMTAEEYYGENYRKFFSQQYSETVFNMACLMDAIAPKCCEKCSSPLRVKELEWRLAKGVENFLCYHCIDKLVKAKSELTPTPTGGLALVEEKEAEEV